MSDAAIMELNLPTGIPFVYELDENLKVIKSIEQIDLSKICFPFQPVVSMKFLGDEETVRKAIASVAAQGKVK